MKRRTQRVNNLIRDMIAEVVMSRLSDPRIDPARTSITRVEMPDDLLTAKVYVSVIGNEAEQRRTLSGLRHASGRIQELMMRQVALRHTPVLQFLPDVQFKKTLQTLEIISRLSEEFEQKDVRQGGNNRPEEIIEDISEQE